ncbi:hypothetical protein S83_004541 [Arachis hypogaea]
MSLTEKGTAAAVTCLAITVDFAGRRCVERRAVGQARDRRGGESCRCVYCRLAIVAIMEHQEAVTEHKYPMEEMKQDLAEELGLTKKQISGWFCHKRLKDKRLLKDEAFAPIPSCHER